MDDAARSARLLADALDREDYGAAEALLSPACVYTFRSESMQGAAAIVESYRANGEWAARAMDEIIYESHVVPSSADVAVITFVDRIRHRGEEHVHTCEQSVEIDATGRICRIRHRDLPGEREAAEAFNRRVGIMN